MSAKPDPVPPAPHHAEDLALMTAVAAGQPDAQHRLIARLRPRTFRVAHALLRARGDVEDAAQGSLLEVLRSARTYRGESSIEAWAQRITVRHTMQLVRDRQVTRAAFDEVDPDDLPHPAAPEETWETLASGVAHYLDRLSEPQRTALVLRHALGHSLPEVAELTGVSVKRVKKRLLRAKELFRKMARQDQVVGLRLKRGER